MKKDNFITEVIFRRWPPNDFNLVIALFPYIINDHKGNVMSYEHIGQHGGADYNGVINGTDPANESEYNDLKSEIIPGFYQN